MCRFFSGHITPERLKRTKRERSDILRVKLFFILISQVARNEHEVEVTLQLTVIQSVCQGIEHTLGLVTREHVFGSCSVAPPFLTSVPETLIPNVKNAG
jgi:predicted membrane protein